MMGKGGIFSGKTRAAAQPRAKRSSAVVDMHQGRRVRFNATTAAPDFAANGRRAQIYRDYYAGPRYGTLPLLATTRARTRFAIVSNPVAKSWVSKLANQMVGRGARMFSLCPDLEMAAKLDQLWRDWAEATRFDATQYHAILAAICGGESFLAYYPRSLAEGLPVGFVMRVMESEQCPADVTRPVPNTNRKIIAGIEFTAIDEPLFYYFHKAHPGDAPIITDYRTLTSMPARRVSHIHDPSRPNEIRSLPWLAQSLLRLSEVDAHEDAQSVKQRISAELTGFLVNKSLGGNEVTGEVMFGPETEEQEDDGGDEEFFAIESLEPGTFPELPEGMGVEWAESQDAGPQYQAFIASQYRAALAGISLPYELGMGDYERIKSDRVLKIARQDFQKIAKMWQKHMLADQICRPTWRHMVLTAEAQGIITRPEGMSDIDFLRCKVLPEGWDYTHPLQDATTDLLLVESGILSRADWANKHDRVAEETDIARAAELRREKELGLSYKSNSSGATGTPEDESAQSNVDDEPEDGDDTGDE